MLGTSFGPVTGGGGLSVVSSMLDSSDLECEDVITFVQSLKERGDAYDCSNQLTTDVASKIHSFELNLKLAETYCYLSFCGR